MPKAGKFTNPNKIKEWYGNYKKAVSGWRRATVSDSKWSRLDQRELWTVSLCCAAAWRSHRDGKSGSWMSTFAEGSWVWQAHFEANTKCVLKRFSIWHNKKSDSHKPARRTITSKNTSLERKEFQALIQSLSAACLSATGQAVLQMDRQQLCRKWPGVFVDKKINKINKNQQCGLHPWDNTVLNYTDETAASWLRRWSFCVQHFGDMWRCVPSLGLSSTRKTLMCWSRSSKSQGNG